MSEIITGTSSEDNQMDICAASTQNTLCRIFLSTQIIARLEVFGRSDCLNELSKYILAKSFLQVPGNCLFISLLSPQRRAVINPNGCPIIARGAKSRQEHPPRGFRIEAGVEPQPVAHLCFRSLDLPGDARDPPTVDLQRTQIMRAVTVADFRSEPARFLIT